MKVQTVKSPTPMYAGVPFLLTHLGLNGTPVVKAINRYPCITDFDMRDGHSTTGPPAFMVPCGKYMLCHNCRAIFESLACQWDVLSGATIIKEAFERALCLWNGNKVSYNFMPFLSAPHMCSDDCEGRYMRLLNAAAETEGIELQP
jgi:hypothetical protein